MFLVDLRERQGRSPCPTVRNEKGSISVTFKDLGLNAPILRALEEQGYQNPSPIQEKAIPPALT